MNNLGAGRAKEWELPTQQGGRSNLISTCRHKLLSPLLNTNFYCREAVSILKGLVLQWADAGFNFKERESNKYLKTPTGSFWIAVNVCSSYRGCFRERRPQAVCPSPLAQLFTSNTRCFTYLPAVTSANVISLFGTEKWPIVNASLNIKSWNFCHEPFKMQFLLLWQ